MPHTFKCHVCSHEFTVSDKLFDERISGKKVLVRCKHCGSPLTATDGARAEAPKDIAAEAEPARKDLAVETSDAAGATKETSLADAKAAATHASPALSRPVAKGALPADMKAAATHASPALSRPVAKGALPADLRAAANHAAPALSGAGMKESAANAMDSAATAAASATGTKPVRQEPTPDQLPTTTITFDPTSSKPAAPRRGGLSSGTLKAVTKPAAGAPLPIQPSLLAAMREEQVHAATTGRVTPAKPTQLRRASSASVPSLQQSKIEEIEEISAAQLLPTDPPVPAPERPVANSRRSIPRGREEPRAPEPTAAAVHEPTAAVAPMPIVALEVDAHGQRPVAADASMDDIASNELAQPTPAHSARHQENYTTHDSESELTPPATSLPPGSDLLRDAQLGSTDAASTEVSRRTAPRLPRNRKIAMLGGAAVMLLSVVVGLVSHNKRPPSMPASTGPTPAARAPETLTQPTLVSSPQHAAPVVTPVASATAAAAMPAAIAKPAAAAAAAVAETAAPHRAAATEVRSEDAAKATTGDEEIPAYASKPAVIHLTGVAIRRAQSCHPLGHAVGTARVFFTFSPNGRVTEAHIEGEPIASAPVARCILDHARAIQMAKFDGPAFTYARSITMR